MDLIISFDLENPKSGDYLKAYKALGAVGFYSTADGIELPTTTVIGKWWQTNTIAEVRGIFWSILSQADVTPSHILVAEYTICGFYGRKV